MQLNSLDGISIPYVSLLEGNLVTGTPFISNAAENLAV
jgi:hypothetical protein